jgi:hypothetical protein
VTRPNASMITLLAFASLAAAPATPAPAPQAAAPPVAGDPPSSEGAASRLDDNLLSAFREICLDRRGSWEGMKGAIESSAFGFQRERGGGRREANYLAFPLSASIKRRGQGELVCLVQSLIEDDISAADLAARLNAYPGMSGVSFAPSDEGLSGALPDSAGSTSVGTISTKVVVRLSPTTLEGAQIAQLVIYQN